MLLLSSSSSPLLLLFCFSFVCLMSGLLLLGDGGFLLSVLRLPTAALLAPASASSVSPPPDSSFSPALDQDGAPRSFALLPSGRSSARLPMLLPQSLSPSASPLQALASFQAYARAANANLSSSASSASDCPGSASFPPASAAHRRHFLMSFVDEAAASGGSAQQLLQWLAGAVLCVSLQLSFVSSPVFPARADWDAFTGLLSGEWSEGRLHMETEALTQRGISPRGVGQALSELRAMQSLQPAAAQQATVVHVRELQLPELDWLNASSAAAEAVLSSVRRKYCLARAYRPVPVDLFAAHRLQPHARSVVVAALIECDDRCAASAEVGGQAGFVRQTAEQILAVMQLVAAAVADDARAAADGAAAASASASASASSSASLPPHVFLHLFADQSAPDGSSNGGSESSVEAVAAQLLDAQAAQPAAFSLHTHLGLPSMWAAHHLITADVAIGQLRGWTARADTQQSARTAAARAEPVCCRCAPPHSALPLVCLQPGSVRGPGARACWRQLPASDPGPAVRPAAAALAGLLVRAVCGDEGRQHSGDTPLLGPTTAALPQQRSMPHINPLLPMIKFTLVTRVC